ncbi:MAG: hypothetical protein ACOXZ2_06130 [Sphaerochaetaceae bacterium]|jgi:hypothetical protein
MRVRAVLVVVVLLVFMMGCATTNPDGTPKWTTNPPTNWRTYYAVGYGKLANEYNSRLKAEAMARDIIARWSGTTVNSALTNYVENYGEDYSIEMMEYISSQVVKISLRETQIEKQYVASDGGVYVLVSYPIKNLKAAYKEQSAAMLRESELDKAQLLIDYLEKELEKEGH